MADKPTPGPWEAEAEVLHEGSHVSGRSPSVFKRGTGMGRTVARCARQLDARIKGGACEEAEANARLIARLANLYFAGIRQEERQATIERELGRVPPDLAYGLTENERAAALMMNALLVQNDALREVAKGFISEHENLEDRAPVDAHCGDCNLGTGQHRRLCPYHAAVAALKP